MVDQATRSIGTIPMDRHTFFSPMLLVSSPPLVLTIVGAQHCPPSLAPGIACHRPPTMSPPSSLLPIDHRPLSMVANATTGPPGHHHHHPSLCLLESARDPPSPSHCHHPCNRPFIKPISPLLPITDTTGPPGCLASPSNAGCSFPPLPCCYLPSKLIMPPMLDASTLSASMPISYVDCRPHARRRCLRHHAASSTEPSVAFYPLEMPLASKLSPSSPPLSAHRNHHQNCHRIEMPVVLPIATTGHLPKNRLSIIFLNSTMPSNAAKTP